VLNFARLGKRHYLLPSMLIGSVLFLVGAWVVLFVVPDEAARLVAPLINVGVGLGFILAQKPFFDAWKARCWGPVKAWKSAVRFRPGGS
jgi:hypothetical protein